MNPVAKERDGIVIGSPYIYMDYGGYSVLICNRRPMFPRQNHFFLPSILFFVLLHFKFSGITV